ncbi:SRPBCC domain-containing protein [Devosia beringensis]|uniref:SRPBCC domain-containing protein n=1 Tax=Devosia beringensis TaxID=2657486 RepID=UPI00186B99A1|nr:SRPBCC domain-containing protein [Devosia beringensis]
MTQDDSAVVFECSLDAPPEKVWRALSIPAYLERWLRPGDDVELAVMAAQENRSLTYHWREAGQGTTGDTEDSVVTFELTPTAEGGTWFKLTHAPMAVPVAANSNIANATLMAA